MTDTSPSRSASDSPIKVTILPHTHWDREWYAPFQDFRHRLVRLLDEFLPRLEADPSYEHFLLDGQTAVIDDYLEVRPEASEILARLGKSGRLGIGPWAILMDEYMVSGETIIRNLQMGIARAEDFGGAMKVGYLPDMFGHVAQMPQILRLAGLDQAVVWRGVPSAIQKTAFWWEALDGSRVRAEFLVGSYSNGRDLPSNPATLVQRAHNYANELGDARYPGGGILFMNGTDHQIPQPWLGAVVAAANAEQSEYRFEVNSLAAYLAEQTSENLPTWRGEMRSGARANVLMGVASNRVDIHQACSAAERIIERRCEPLQALHLSNADYASAEMDIAWRQLILNSAHDSSCACSADDVVDAVMVRYREALHIGEGLTREALDSLANRVSAPSGSVIVANATATQRDGVVICLVSGDTPMHLRSLDSEQSFPTQQLRVLGGEVFATTVTSEQIPNSLEMVRGPEFAGTLIERFEIEVLDDESVDVRAFAAAAMGKGVDLEDLRDQVFALSRTHKTFHLRVLRAPAQVVAFNAGAIPGFGWRTFEAVEGAGPTTLLGGGETATYPSICNEFLTLSVDPGDATYTITTVGAAGEESIVIAGLGRIVEGGDGGDTYNYSPPASDQIVDSPISVRVRVEETGPVFARCIIEADYLWPTNAIGDERSCGERSTSLAQHTVVTTLELRVGEQFVRVTHDIDNRARDHRVRAHFPLPKRVSGSSADCAFAVVERGLETEGGPHEYALPTWVSRRFVDCSDGAQGLGLVHDGLLEYEVVNDGTELALTLLRSVGYLSRSEMKLRPNPAGPLLPVEGAQLQKRLQMQYCVVAHSGDWVSADMNSIADRFLIPLETASATGSASADREATGSALQVTGAVVSTLRREGGALILRAFNPLKTPALLEVSVSERPIQGEVVDLIGEALAPFTGALALRPNEIVTVRLAD